MALFEATNGPKWIIKSGWNTDADISDWYGVTVDSWGRVSTLELRGNGLTGACILDTCRAWHTTLLCVYFLS